MLAEGVDFSFLQFEQCFPAFRVDRRDSKCAGLQGAQPQTPLAVGV